MWRSFVVAQNESYFKTVLIHSRAWIFSPIPLLHLGWVLGCPCLEAALLKGSWSWRVPEWAMLLRVVQGDWMKTEAPWWGGDSQVMWSGGRDWLSLPRTLFSSHWNHAFAIPHFSLHFSFFTPPFHFPSLFLPFPFLSLFLSPHSQLCTSHPLQVLPAQRQKLKQLFPPSFISSMFSLYSSFIIIITTLQSLLLILSSGSSFIFFLLWIGHIFLFFICWVICCCCFVLNIMSVVLWRDLNLLYSYGECWVFALAGN